MTTEKEATVIEIRFTCAMCGRTEIIKQDDIEGKESAPLCDACWKIFQRRRKKLEGQIRILHSTYGVYFYPMEE